MDHTTYNKFLKTVRIMSTDEMRDKVGMIFSNNILNGLFFKNQYGFASFGESDGELHLVSMHDFFDLSVYLDILNARKTVNASSIKFWEQGKSGDLDIVDKELVELDFWKKGGRIFLRSEFLFPVPGGENYFLCDKEFIFSGAAYQGKVKGSSEAPEGCFQFTPVFVNLLAEDFEIIKMDSKGVYLFFADLEVYITTGITVYDKSPIKFFSQLTKKALKGKVIWRGKQLEKLYDGLALLSHKVDLGVGITSVRNGIELYARAVRYRMGSKLKLKKSWVLPRSVIPVVHAFPGKFNTAYFVDGLLYLRGEFVELVCDLWEQKE